MDKATPDSAPTPEILRARMVRRWMGLIEEAYQSRDDILTSAGYTPRSLGLNFVADQIRAEVERLAAQAARDDAALYQTIGERDNYHKWADKLAEGIAAHLGVDIGEHTAGAGANNPWANALEAIQAVAQSAPLAQQAREYPPLPKLPTMTVLSELQSGTQEMVRLDVAHEAMRAYVDADRAAAQVEPPAQRSNHATDQRRT